MRDASGIVHHSSNISDVMLHHTSHINHQASKRTANRTSMHASMREMNGIQLLR